MSTYINAEDLKKHIRWELYRPGGLTLKQCQAVDSIIDLEKAVDPFARDKGMEPILETKQSLTHVLYADGTGGVESRHFEDWTCPQCGWFVGQLYSGTGRWHIQRDESYCSQCGQKIDWTIPKEEVKKRYEESRALERKRFEEKNGVRLDNMNESRRIKYGITKAQDE